MEQGHIESHSSSKLYGHISKNFIAQFITLLINFATAPYIVYHLGADLFGMVALVQSISGLAGVLNVGIGRALTRYVSTLYWKGDVKQINELFQTAWSICLLSGIGAMCLLFWFDKQLGLTLLHDGSEVNKQLAAFALNIAGVGLLCAILSEGIGAIPLATQRFGIRNGIQVIVTTVWCLGSVGLLRAGYDVRYVLYLNLFSNLIGVVGLIAVSKKIIPGLRLFPRMTVRGLRTLLVFSLPLTLSALFALLIARLDRFILAYYLPLAAVAFYTLPYSLSEKLSLAVSNIISVVFPFTSELYARSATKAIHDIYIRSSRLMLIVIMPIANILIVLSGPVLEFWLGIEFAKQGAGSLVVLTLGAFFNSITAIPTVTLLGIGRVWLPSTFAFVVAMLSLLLNVLLIPRYGIIGAAYALFLPQLCLAPVVVLAVNRAIRLPAIDFCEKVVLRPLLSAGAQFLFLAAIHGLVNSVVSLLVAIAVSLVIFGIITFAFVLAREERLLLIASLEKFFNLRYR